MSAILNKKYADTLNLLVQKWGAKDLKKKGAKGHVWSHFDQSGRNTLGLNKRESEVFIRLYQRKESVKATHKCNKTSVSFVVEIPVTRFEIELKD